MSRPRSTDEQSQKMPAESTPDQFRILVIGRANAGKTTILRRLCDAIGEPIILGPNGEKVKHILEFTWCQILTSMSMILDWVIDRRSILESKRRSYTRI